MILVSGKQSELVVKRGACTREPAPMGCWPVVKCGGPHPRACPNDRYLMAVRVHKPTSEQHLRRRVDGDVFPTDQLLSTLAPVESLAT